MTNLANMDVIEIRKHNLLYLLDEVLRPRGIVRNKDASQALGGIGESYLSQLKGGKKMGDDTARRIEKALALRHGVMDAPMWKRGSVNESQPPPYADLSPREAALLANYRAADEKTKNVVDAAAAAGAKPVKLGRTG